MILPIGHEETTVRRLPWVTFAIMLVCVAALVATDPGASTQRRSHSTDFLRMAADYWRQHAYLEAHPRVLTQVGYDVLESQRETYIELLQAQARETNPYDAMLWSQQQRELDELTERALSDPALFEAEDPRSPYQKWGLTPAEPTPLTFFAHMFMHAGWVHLVGNLFLFFLAAPAIEDRWGRPIFAAFFVLAGLFSGAFFALMTPGSAIPLVGASGAIAGVLGAFLVRYRAAKIRFFYVFFIGFRLFTGTFHAAAWLMLPLWFGTELAQAWISDSLNGSDGIAYWAHVGGFVFGAAFALGMRSARVEERLVHPAIESKITVAANRVVQEALVAVSHGESEAAYRMLEEEVRRNPGDQDAAAAFWDVAVSLQRTHAAAQPLLRVIRDQLSRGDAKIAAHYWREMSESAPQVKADPALLMRLVPVLLGLEQRQAAMQALRQAVDPRNGDLSPGLAARAVDTALSLDPSIALLAARRALEAPDLHAAKRSKLEGLVAELEAQGVSDTPGTITIEGETGPASAPPPALPEVADEFGPELDSTSSGLDLDPERSSVPDASPLETQWALNPIGAPEPREPGPTLPPPRALGADGQLSAADPDSELQEPEAPAREAHDALAGLGAPPRFADLKVVEVVPTGLTGAAIALRDEGGKQASLAFSRIAAISVAAVHGLAPRMVVLIDLVLNWNDTGSAPLHVLRLRGDRFDPRRLVPGAADALDALRKLLDQLHAHSQAVPLPDPQGARGDPLRVFTDPRAYQREVLQVDC